VQSLLERRTRKAGAVLRYVDTVWTLHILEIDLLHDAPVYEMDGELLWQRLAFRWFRLGQSVVAKLSEIQLLRQGRKARGIDASFLAIPMRARWILGELRSLCPTAAATPMGAPALVMRFARLRIDSGTAAITLRQPESATSPSYDRGLVGDSSTAGRFLRQ